MGTHDLLEKKSIISVAPSENHTEIKLLINLFLIRSPLKNPTIVTFREKIFVNYCSDCFRFTKRNFSLV